MAPRLKQQPREQAILIPRVLTDSRTCLAVRPYGGRRVALSPMTKVSEICFVFLSNASNVDRSGSYQLVAELHSGWNPMAILGEDVQKASSKSLFYLGAGLFCDCSQLRHAKYLPQKERCFVQVQQFVHMVDMAIWQGKPALETFNEWIPLRGRPQFSSKAHAFHVKVPSTILANYSVETLKIYLPLSIRQGWAIWTNGLISNKAAFYTKQRE